MDNKRKKIMDLINIGIASVMPSNIMPAILNYDKQRKILKVKNKKYKIRGRIFVVGGGKASGRMAEELEKIVPVADGVINTVAGNYKTKNIEIVQAGHPIPTQAGVRGVKKMFALKDKYEIGQDDLVIALISGGGSALLPCPSDGITLKEKQKITEELIKSGADIHKINKIRKKYSKVKGGKLAKYFAPTRVVSLIISDVVGNDLKTIASGPTVAANAHNFIIADNMSALKAMAKKSKAKIITNKLSGDSEKAAKKIAANIIKGKYKNSLILFGGETTPTVPVNHGKGGRNMHFAAITMIALKNYTGAWAMASVATDGTDFMDGIGGAIINNKSLDKLKRVDTEKYIKKFDSYNLLKKVPNSLLKSTNSGTNVGDIIVYLIK